MISLTTVLRVGLCAGALVIWTGCRSDASSRTISAVDQGEIDGHHDAFDQRESDYIAGAPRDRRDDAVRPPVRRDQPPRAGYGPPSWAPAQGHSARYDYRYYPDSEVYYEPGRNRYYYQQRGEWRESEAKPDRKLGRHVQLQMDDAKPYRYHDEVRGRYRHQ